MNVWDKCRLQQALAWMYEGAVLSNAPIGPTDVRNANAQMINITAVTSDGRQWFDDLPADQNPFNPDNRDRALELMGVELEV